MSDKPREFWIDLSHSCQLGDAWVCESENEADERLIDAIHVTEYSAFEQACKERDKFKAALEQIVQKDQVGFISEIALEALE